jgi:hypothetical protein
VALAGLPLLVPPRGSVSRGHIVVTAPKITFCSLASRCKALPSLVARRPDLLDSLVEAARTVRTLANSEDNFLDFSLGPCAGTVTS